MENGHRVTKEEVIAELKDDGDFDRLRLKIIRRLKDNEELRDKIISIVKQSAALNRPGAENMKPRQLSDTIYEEVRGEVMGHISEGLWGIIKSPDGMKTEITDTVESVYRKLVDPNGTEIGHSSMLKTTSNWQAVNGGSFAVSSGEKDGVSDSEPIEPRGFSLAHNRSNHDDWSNQDQRPFPHERSSSEDLKDSRESAHILTSKDANMPDESRKLLDDSDEDPPLPPGFG
ncbi:uncharacterized protein LOC116189386 [Punica granatum]|uniref:Uncharacterized protein LOC116189386 n=1 Tax=Punica granatum TaxID=22663 RepID=A0A218WGI7_PUNGR|nr:uncharacterized protein LOC116189386 [Punica granatum]OWM71947.1 hypothetical protein CDL15_Pgr017830 [Punica granatum]